MEVVVSEGENDPESSSLHSDLGTAQDAGAAASGEMVAATSSAPSWATATTGDNPSEPPPPGGGGGRRSAGRTMRGSGRGGTPSTQYKEIDPSAREAVAHRNFFNGE